MEQQARAGIHVKPAGEGYYAYTTTEFVGSDKAHTLSLSGFVKLAKGDQVRLHVASLDGSYSVSTGSDCSLVRVEAAAGGPTGVAAQYSQRTDLADYIFPTGMTPVGNWTPTPHAPMHSADFSMVGGTFHVRNGQGGLYHISFNAQLKYTSVPLVEIRKNGAVNPGLTAAAESASDGEEHSALLAQVIPNVQWKACFRLSKDGRSPSTFHKQV